MPCRDYFAEAFYQKAKCNARLKDVGKSVYALGKAITLDKTYCIKACNDETFSSMKPEIESMIKSLKDNIVSECEGYCNNLELFSETYMKVMSKHAAVFNTDTTFERSRILKELPDLENTLHNGGYLDCINARPKVEELVKSKKQAITELGWCVRNHINRLNKSLRKDLDMARSNRVEREDTIWNVTMLVGILITVIWSISAFSPSAHTLLGIAIIDVVFLSVLACIARLAAKLIVRLLYPDPSQKEYDAVEKKKSELHSMLLQTFGHKLDLCNQ